MHPHAHPHRSTRSTRSTRSLGALALGLALTLTACGEDEPGPPASAGVSQTEHGDADVAFATDMVQHHAQALAMVDLTVGRPLDPQVEQLAEQIRAAQAPEIEQMADWLLAWGEEVPATVRDHAHAGHDSGGDPGEAMAGMADDMPGMMSAEEMTALGAASDADFQRRWLTLMVEHHRGAVEMAETELAQGRYAPAVELAGAVVETQGAEIQRMQELLGS